MTTDMNDSLARRLFQRADDQWQAALVREYGAAAGDARYDARGTATDELRALKDTRDAAMNDWHFRNEARRRVLGGYR